MEMITDAHRIVYVIESYLEAGQTLPFMEGLTSDQIKGLISNIYASRNEPEILSKFMKYIPIRDIEAANQAFAIEARRIERGY